MKPKHTSIKVVRAELLDELHEVALDERDLVLEACVLGVLARAADLVFVVVETDDLHVGEARDLPSGTTNTATNVEDAHTGLEAHLGGKVMFVARE